MLNGQVLPEKLPLLLINEVQNNEYENDDFFIELVVLKENELAYNKNSNEPHLIIDDSEDAGDIGFISIDPSALTYLKQGDIIVIHGKNTDISSGVGKALLLDASGPGIKKWKSEGSGSDFYNSVFPLDDQSYPIKKLMAFSQKENKYQTRIKDTYINKIDQPGERNTSLYKDGFKSYSSLPPSLGYANNKENALMIENLKSSGPFKINCSVFGENRNNVHIVSEGLAPYTLSTSYDHEEEFLYHSFDIYDLACGSHTLTVTDKNGKVDVCEIYIGADEVQDIVKCKDQEFTINSYLCNCIESNCINVQVNDGQMKKYSTVDEIPPFKFEDQGTILITIGDSNGDIDQSYTFNIIVFGEGDSCNDDNDCTINDKYDADCNCKGTAIENLEVVEHIEEECSNEGRKLMIDLAASDQFVWTTWYLEDSQNSGRTLVGTEKEITLYQGGRYILEATTSDDCRLTAEYDVIWYNGSNDYLVTADPLIICMGEESELSIPDGLEDIRWSTGESGDAISVTSSGTYNVSFTDNGCLGTASIEVISPLGGITIEPEVPVYCPGELIELSLLNVPNHIPDTDIVWSQSGETGRVLTVNQPGTFTATITDQSSGNGCSIEKSITVIGNQDFQSIADVLLENGFEQLELAGQPAFKSSDQIDERSVSCNYIEGDLGVFIDVLDNGIDAQLVEDYLCDILSQGIQSTCSSETQALYYNSVCDGETNMSKLDELMHSNAPLKGITLLDNQGKWFFFLKDKKKCDFLPLVDRGLFDSVLEEIICAIHNGEQSLQLSLTIPSKKDQTDNAIASGEGVFFDGNSYTSFTEDNPDSYFIHEFGIILNNYQNGESLNLTAIDFEAIPDFCISEDGESQNLFAAKIPYVNCDDVLEIIVHDDFKVEIENMILNPELLVEKFVKEPLDLNYIIQNADRLSTMPACLFECDDLCALYNGLKQQVLPEGVIEAVTDSRFLDESDCIIDCFNGDNEKYPKPIINKWEFVTNQSRIGLFANLTTHFFNSKRLALEIGNNENDPYFMGLGKHLGLGDYLEIDYSEKQFQACRCHVYGIGHTYDIREFSYFKMYPISLSKATDHIDAITTSSNDDEILIDDGYKADIYVPGVYIAYAVEQFNDYETNARQVGDVAQVASVIWGFGKFTQAYRLVSVNKWARALGLTAASTSVLSNTADIFMEEILLCNNIPATNPVQEEKIQDFCAVLKPIVAGLDIIALTSGVANISHQSFLKAKAAYYKTGENIQIGTASILFTGQGSIERADRLRRFFEYSGDPLLDLPIHIRHLMDDILLEKFEDVPLPVNPQPAPFFNNWVTKVNSPHVILELISLLNDMDWRMAHDFIYEVMNEENTISTRFAEMTPELLAIYKAIYESQPELRKSFEFLKEYQLNLQRTTLNEYIFCGNVDVVLDANGEYEWQAEGGHSNKNEGIGDNKFIEYNLTSAFDLGDGYYKKSIQIYSDGPGPDLVLKPFVSYFFPDNWDQPKIIEEITVAFMNKEPYPTGNNIYNDAPWLRPTHKGIMSDGTPCFMIIENDIVVGAWPFGNL